MAGAKYRIFRQLVRGIITLYYRSVESYGRSFLPKRGRTLLIANHQTGLIDGLVMIGSNDAVVRTLAKHTLWANPVIGLFASGLGMIPVYRKQDVTGAQADQTPGDRNKEAYQQVENSFERGEFVLLFPEGRSHDSSHILRLRSGAARMLLETEAHNDFRLGLKWLPVSIDYEKKHQPGTRILLHYHPARSIAHLRELYKKDSEAAVEKLRAEMEDYLKEITINYSTWADRVFIERLTELWLAAGPQHQLLDRHNYLLKWKRVMEHTAQEDAALWEQLRESVRELYGSLTLLNLTPRDIYRRRSPLARRRLATKVIFRMFVWSPVIAAGLLFWLPPTKLVKWVARKFAPSMDVVSSYQIVASIIAYPLWLLIVFPWVLSMVDQQASLGLMILAVSSGLSVLLVSRILRPAVREVLALYRFENFADFIGSTDQKIQNIWVNAGRLWNRGLRRQVIIEDVLPPQDPTDAPMDPVTKKAS